MEGETRRVQAPASESESMMGCLKGGIKIYMADVLLHSEDGDGFRAEAHSQAL